MAMLDYGRPEGRQVSNRLDAVVLNLIIVSIGLTIGSIIVVWLGATEEPYFRVVAREEFIQVYVGSALMVFWGLWCTWLIVEVIRRRVHPALLITLLWAVICCFYLSQSVRGYLWDTERFRTGNFPGGPNWQQK